MSVSPSKLFVGPELLVDLEERYLDRDFEREGECCVFRARLGALEEEAGEEVGRLLLFDQVLVSLADGPIRSGRVARSDSTCPRAPWRTHRSCTGRGSFLPASFFFWTARGRVISSTARRASIRTWPKRKRRRFW